MNMRVTFRGVLFFEFLRTQTRRTADSSLCASRGIQQLQNTRIAHEREWKNCD